MSGFRGAAILFALVFSGGCSHGEARSPSSSEPPADLTFNRLTTPDIARQHVGQRVRTVAQFMVRPPMVGNMGKYSKGWVGATFSDVRKKPDGSPECPATGSAPNLAGMMGGGVSVMAPSSVGDPWIDEKTGAVYELTGTVQKDQGLPGMLSFEVDSMTRIGECK